MSRRHLAMALVGGGLALIVAGIALVYAPAALVVGGLAIGTIGFLGIDVEKK